MPVVSVNKERLKAAMEAADRAEAGAASGEDASSDDIWGKLDKLLEQAGQALDKIKTFDHNINIAATVATTMGTLVNSTELVSLLAAPELELRSIPHTPHRTMTFKTKQPQPK